MAQQGPSLATAAANTGPVGADWQNTANALVHDDAVASVAALTTVTKVLSLSAFGFTIPPDATILGIEVAVRRSSSSSPPAVDSLVTLTKSGAQSEADNLANSGTSWPSSLGDVTYGGPTELWGATWTPAEVNASTFGVLFQAQKPSGFASQASVAWIEVTVYYEGGAPPPPLERVFLSVTEANTLMTLTNYTALARMLAALDAATALDDAEVKLIAAGIVPTPSTLIADLTEADYTGYAEQGVTPPGAIYLDAGGNVTWAFPELVFQPSGTATTNLIYGWWMESEVLGSGLTIVALEVFDEPVSMGSPLDALFVRPRIPLGQPR